MWNVPLFPDQASTLAGRVDVVTFVLLGVSAFFTLLIFWQLLYFGIKFRAGSAASRAGRVNANHKMEYAWIGGTFALCVFLFLVSAQVFYDQYVPPPDAMDVSVVGKQWMWYVQHPEGRRETNELHVPLGRAVKLNMISQDVIHSFYVPAFRMKQDVLPGRYTSTWFQPTKTGEFYLFCAEYCGTNHSLMGGKVVVMEPADYEAWLSRQTDGGSGGPVAGGSMASVGARLAQRYHCNDCHGQNTTAKAPSWVGIFGKNVPVKDGSGVRLVKVDERYIRDSILTPQAEVVAGYEPSMPSFKGQISEDDLMQIIAYIKTLGRKTGGMQ